MALEDTEDISTNMQCQCYFLVTDNSFASTGHRILDADSIDNV